MRGCPHSQLVAGLAGHCCVVPGAAGGQGAAPGWGLPGLSSGPLSLEPRRVHISQSTMDCLKGEFDVEPGEGGSRCDYLEEKGIETYLIIASKPEVKKTAAQNGLNGSVSPPPAPQA